MASLKSRSELDEIASALAWADDGLSFAALTGVEQDHYRRLAEAGYDALVVESNRDGAELIDDLRNVLGAESAAAAARAAVDDCVALVRAAYAATTNTLAKQTLRRLGEQMKGLHRDGDS